MPNNSSTVGGLTLPLPAGALNASFDDPTVVGLADFLAFMLNDCLNAKLANMQGTSAQAVPAGSVFPYDPGAYFVRNAIPALYVWWPGRSRRTPWTPLYDVRERTILALYVYDELVAPGALLPRNGLVAAVDAVFFRAAEHGYHPSYGYGGDPPGTPLYKSIGIKGWAYDGGEAGFITAIPRQSEGPGFGEGDGNIARGYPSLRAAFTVYEVVGRMGKPESPADDNNLLQFGVYATEEEPITNGVHIRGGDIPV
jgi:hypothetical protein